jgi:hypothetical protein
LEATCSCGRPGPGRSFAYSVGADTCEVYHIQNVPS